MSLEIEFESGAAHFFTTSGGASHCDRKYHDTRKFQSSSAAPISAPIVDAALQQPVAERRWASKSNLLALRQV
jgi:hypothetical protein